MRSLAAVLLSAVCVAVVAQTPPPRENSMNVPSAMARLASGRVLNTVETMALGADPDAVAALASALRDAPAAVRQKGVSLMTDLGRIRVPPEGVVRERPGPIVVVTGVVEFLVSALDDTDPDVRRKAGVTLAGLVPGDLLKPRAQALVEAFKRHPTTDGALIVLGKTASPAARAFVDAEPAFLNAPPEDLEMVRARLGDAKAEDAVIVAYIGARTPQDKALQARRLGYVATDRAVHLLARDIRTPETYAWIDAALRSMRLHVIEGLHLAYAREPVFWPPYISPGDDSYYERVEAWLTQHLGVRWDQPRPPFLYQQDAPMAVPPPSR
jgi:hypothetical protein